MHGRRVLILTVALSFVCSAGGLFQRSATTTTKANNSSNVRRRNSRTFRRWSRLSIPRSWRTRVSRCQRLARRLAAPVTPKPLAFGAPDKSEGEISVKWQSNHFVKGQSGDTYVPFTIAVDKAQLSKGAALYVRIVSAEQAAAFASAMVAMATPPKDKKPAAPPPRPTFQWDSVHFLDAGRPAFASGAAQAWTVCRVHCSQGKVAAHRREISETIAIGTTTRTRHRGRALGQSDCYGTRSRFPTITSPPEDQLRHRCSVG